MFVGVHKRLKNQDKSSLMRPNPFTDVHSRALEANTNVGFIVGPDPKTQHADPTRTQQ
jgi:hypothetical protein